jgi:hypothetical protein
MWLRSASASTVCRAPPRLQTAHRTCVSGGDVRYARIAAKTGRYRRRRGATSLFHGKGNASAAHTVPVSSARSRARVVAIASRRCSDDAKAHRRRRRHRRHTAGMRAATMPWRVLHALPHQHHRQPRRPIHSPSSSSSSSFSALRTVPPNRRHHQSSARGRQPQPRARSSSSS